VEKAVSETGQSGQIKVASPRNKRREPHEAAQEPIPIVGLGR
jgi:hypothetical protein